MGSEQQWHQFEALRDDGAPARFRIRDLAARLDQPNIFVVELPYPIIDLSRLPDAATYRRIATFEENWLIPAAEKLGWTFVAAKIDDGSCFLYLYGAGDPGPMIERLAPFDASLGFYDEVDPEWDEYAALKELLEEANAIADEENDNTTTIAIPVIDESATTIVRPLAEIQAMARAARPAAPTIPIVKPVAKPKASRKRTARGTAQPASKATRPAKKTTRLVAKPAKKKPAPKKPVAARRGAKPTKPGTVKTKARTAPAKRR